MTRQISATSASSHQEKEEGGREGRQAGQQQQQQQQQLYPRRIIRRTLLDENLLEYTEGEGGREGGVVGNTGAIEN